MYQSGINNRKDIEILFEISDKIKNIISSIDIKCFKNILNSHYRTLKLIDDNGKWMTEKLNNLSDILIPKCINSDILCVFIDEITMLCTRNNYLMNFLKECTTKKFDNLKMKFGSEEKEVIMDVVMYAYMVDILSKECSKNCLILEEIYHCFSVNRNKMKSFKDLPFVCKFKLLSVEKSIRSYIKCHKNKTVQSGFGSIDVSKSIFEFICADIVYGELGNVKAGFILAKNRCGLKKNEEGTGAGPSRWSEDGKIIEHLFPLAESWNNLYQVWNMCSVIKFKDFPYRLSNLLIPQVSNYYSNPNKYIYNMNIALYISLNFLSFSYNDKKRKREKVMDWRDKELKRVFLSSNRNAAKIYNEKLKRAKV